LLNNVFILSLLP